MAVAEVEERRVLVPATLDHERAARMETAASHGSEGVGHLALDRGEPILFDVEPGYRAQQADGVRVLRLGEECRHGGALDDAAGVHHHHIVGELGDDTEIVGDENDRGAGFLAQRAHQVEYLRLNGHVERGRGLISDQKLRLARERHRDHHPLPHAARKPVRIIAEALLRRRNVNHAQHLDRQILCRIPAHRPMTQDAFDYLLAHRQHRVERGHRLLEDHRDAIAAKLSQGGRRKPQKIDAIEQDLAAGDPPGRARHQAHDRQCGDALAATGLADDAERSSRIDRKADAVDRGEFAALDLKECLERANIEQRAHCSRCIRAA